MRQENGCRTLSDLRIGRDQRREFHHPAVQRDVVDRDATLGHDLFKVAVGDSLTDIQKHGVQDDGLRKMHAPEINRHGQPLT